ncbi:CoA pyrophosphatase [Pseudidiomarina terrestris]|uniref:CoA pyrophosphatase n=1 Tax=Pseudidiomarina terrestris TaxID=2820060 RepID=A0AAW7QUF8_9GAMM|nr:MULTISPECIES: CoA pyrophosphatase [unclassified Pseudidiomarina]MDN7123896.1 CoA pyrophosphatase [Pseudidiomarina sp. 1APP75-32.1]MDN7127650.1 CoA pyrophosphatase [Pseudidiomarina sp. 1APR75-33.1]MDN7130396.1 CoA pyrophosphatase [Pseudidiomarina sp. 1APR75-15]MDN7136319.1 CoA pyrophosphatase [Pseudidiomarina sp. 1ASP75-5]MDN7138764.1 CoA pyrophosphatase [Pseudidiomarina sp. 1ASP75-14]
MTKDEFLHRFQLHPTRQGKRPVRKRLRPAAVLIPLWERDGELQLVLTQRAANLRHHAGQISFPGGRQEPADRSLYETALREAHEEIALEPSAVTLVGQLQDYPVISNFLIRPYVAFIDPQHPLQADPREVAEIFTVPLKHVLHQQEHFAYRLRRFLYDQVYFIPYQHRNIWGATAGILRELADHVYPERHSFFRSLN